MTEQVSPDAPPTPRTMVSTLTRTLSARVTEVARELAAATKELAEATAAEEAMRQQARTRVAAAEDNYIAARTAAKAHWTEDELTAMGAPVRRRRYSVAASK